MSLDLYSMKLFYKYVIRLTATLSLVSYISNKDYIEYPKPYKLCRITCLISGSNFLKKPRLGIFLLLLHF